MRTFILLSFSYVHQHGEAHGRWLQDSQDRLVVKVFVTGKLFSSTQKKHKPIMRLWSRMKLSLRKTGTQGLGTSAGLSLRSTTLPATSARTASFRCWCAWEPGNCSLGPGGLAANLGGGAAGVGSSYQPDAPRQVRHVCVSFCGVGTRVCVTGLEEPSWMGRNKVTPLMKCEAEYI